MRAIRFIAKLLIAHVAASYICMAVYLIQWSQRSEIPLQWLLRVTGPRFILRAPIGLIGLFRGQFAVGGEKDDYTGFATAVVTYLIALCLACWILFRRWSRVRQIDFRP